MIYKFQSQSVADIIMLEPDGDQLLKIIGKVPSARGIVTVAQIPAAIAALQAAVLAHEAAHGDAVEHDPAIELEPSDDTVSLRARSSPLLSLLRNSAIADVDVLWGV